MSRNFFCNLLRRRFLQHLPGGELAVSEARVEIFDLAETVLARHAFELGPLNAGQLYTEAPRFLFEKLLADLDGALALVLVDDVLDFVTRAGGLDETEPVLARQVTGLGQNVDDIAVPKHISQGDDAAVDLCAGAGISDFGVD